MIWKSVSGAVRSSSIVPERFSSEYVRIVTIGRMNRKMTVVFRKTGRISCSLTLTALRSAAETGHLHALPIEIEQQRVEEVTEHHRVETDHDVGDRRGEVAFELLVGDGEDVTHGWPPLRPRVPQPLLRS